MNPDLRLRAARATTDAATKPMPATPGSAEPLVRMRGITKRFGNVTVLECVDLDIHAGEVLILAGENGAGKSTLIKILGGVHSDYEGTVEVSGRIVRSRSPLEAGQHGVSVIFQELSLVPNMTVADNIFLERPITRAGLVDFRAQETKARDLLAKFGIEIDVTRCIEDLPISQQQLVEIGKALSRDARVIVMDEPTSALNAPEVEKLFALVQDLKARGCGIVYITHKMEEIERIADRIAVLRDGRHVGTAPARELPPSRLIEWMVGREFEEQFPPGRQRTGNERLRVENYSVRPNREAATPAVENVSFTVGAGEIVGVAGLHGSGNTDLFWGLFGAFGRRVTGRALLNGNPLRIRSPRCAIEQKIAMLTNDRKANGLVLPLSIIANTTLASLPRLCTAGFRRQARERSVAGALARKLSLSAASLDQEVVSLSGGNQQKVALAKWLQTEPQLLLLDEPTRGIDVAAKRDIYEILTGLAAEGISILLITSELPELLALSDRILVMHRGRLTAEFSRAQATAENIIHAAMGRETRDS